MHIWQSAEHTVCFLWTSSFLMYPTGCCLSTLCGDPHPEKGFLQAVSALLEIAKADAQSITTLRAMAKSSQPGLIAGLAHNTASLYRAAVGFANNSPFSLPGNKAARYAEYKGAAFLAYALCFTGKCC